MRRVEFDLSWYDLVSDLDWQLSNASLEVDPLGLQFQNGDCVELDVQRQFYRPTEDFALIPGATVRAGASWWNRVEVQYSGAEARGVRLSVTASSGLFVVWNRAWPAGSERSIPWSRPIRGGSIDKQVYCFRKRGRSRAASGAETSADATAVESARVALDSDAEHPA